MNTEERDLLRALYEGQRLAEAERKSDRALLEEIITERKSDRALLEEIITERKSDRAALDSMAGLLATIGAKLDRLVDSVSDMKDEISELNARDRYFMHKLGEHEAEISVIKHQLKAK